MSTEQRSDLPLPDYDQLSAGELEHRVRSLSQAEIDQLIRHERAHGARVHMVEILRSRQAQLAAGSTPSPGGVPTRSGGERETRRGSPVSPATASQPVHPPPHGTPHQSGRPKGNRQP